MGSENKEQPTKGYKCKKGVLAAKIKSVDLLTTGALIKLESGYEGTNCGATKEFLALYDPKPGDYIVYFDDRMVCFTPEKFDKFFERD